VTVTFSRNPRGIRTTALLAIAALLVPLPLLAADTKAARSTQPLQTSIATHAKREVLVSTPKTSGSARATSGARAQSNDPHTTGFFRSPAGIACLAVIGAGTGYALYSASHDRIHSVVRQNQ